MIAYKHRELILARDKIIKYATLSPEKFSQDALDAVHIIAQRFFEENLARSAFAAILTAETAKVIVIYLLRLDQSKQFLNIPFLENNFDVFHNLTQKLSILFKKPMSINKICTLQELVDNIRNLNLTELAKTLNDKKSIDIFAEFCDSLVNLLAEYEMGRHKRPDEISWEDMDPSDLSYYSPRP